jgi:hypothetical protein
MLVPYPTEFPNEALLLLLDKIRGKANISTADLLHAGWCVQGYAQAQLVGGGPVVSAEPPAGWTDEEIIQGAIEANQGAKGFGLVPWFLVVKIAIKLIMAAL